MLQSISLEIDDEYNRLTTELDDEMLITGQLESILAEIREGGVSKSIMATVESIRPILQERYPLESFTILPSETNLSVANESIIGLVAGAFALSVKAVITLTIKIIAAVLSIVFVLFGFGGSSSSGGGGGGGGSSKITSVPDKISNTVRINTRIKVLQDSMKKALDGDKSNFNGSKADKELFEAAFGTCSRYKFDCLFDTSKSEKLPGDLADAIAGIMGLEDTIAASTDAMYVALAECVIPKKQKPETYSELAKIVHTGTADVLADVHATMMKVFQHLSKVDTIQSALCDSAATVAGNIAYTSGGNGPSKIWDSEKLSKVKEELIGKNINDAFSMLGKLSSFDKQIDVVMDGYEISCKFIGNSSTDLSKTSDKLEKTVKAVTKDLEDMVLPDGDGIKLLNTFIKNKPNASNLDFKKVSITSDGAVYPIDSVMGNLTRLNKVIATIAKAMHEVSVQYDAHISGCATVTVKLEKYLKARIVAIKAAN